jgi:hypothetical protein
LYIEFPVTAGFHNFNVEVDYKSVSLGTEIEIVYIQ